MEDASGTEGECRNFGHSTDCGTKADGKNRIASDHLSGETDELMTMQEAAKMLKISVRTLYRYLDSGRIPRSYRLPGKRLVAREDILAFMDSCADKRTA